VSRKTDTPDDVRELLQSKIRDAGLGNDLIGTRLVIGDQWVGPARRLMR